MHYTKTLSVIGSVLNLTGLSVERWNINILNMTTDVRFLSSRTFDFRNIGGNIKFFLIFPFPLHLKSSFGWLHVIGCFPFQYSNWEVGIFKRIWNNIYGIRLTDDHQRKISTEVSDSPKLELNFDWSYNISNFQFTCVFAKWLHVTEILSPVIDIR